MPRMQAGEFRENELRESPVAGPFGGIQSECPLHIVEQFGFADCLNIMLRQGRATVRGSYSNVFNGVGIPFVGISDFVTNQGLRITFANTATGAVAYQSGAQAFGGIGKTDLPGTFQGTLTNLYDYATVGGKIFFSQGIDPIHYWDGIVGVVSPVNMTLPAFYLMELDNRLIAMYTTESGTSFPQRVRYSNAGDGTDFTTSLATGAYDRFNDLGVIAGGKKLGQYGYVFQNFGVGQMQPTGNGLNPFAFITVASRPKGTFYPYTIKVFGEDSLCYVGNDDIYNFDGSNFEPIGSYPIEGASYRGGARSRILAELKQVTLPGTVFAVRTAVINGNAFNAYWLFIPNFSTWVFNFDEGSWTRFQWAKTPVSAGVFYQGAVYRIQDLQGQISQQTWTPQTLSGTNPFDSLGISWADGTFGSFDFTGSSEVGWQIDFGQKALGDYRHDKTWEKIRLIYEDVGPVTFSIQLSNNRGQSITVGPVTIGTGSGLVKEIMIPCRISGIWVRALVTGEAAQPLILNEFTPCYDLGGESRVSA